MVVVGLNQRVPQAAVRRVADGVNRFQVRVDGRAKLRHADKIADGAFHRFMRLSLLTMRRAAGDLFHRPDVADFSALQRHGNPLFDWDLVQRSTLRDMLLEDEAELLLLGKFIRFLPDAVPQDGVCDLLDQFIDCRHSPLPFNVLEYCP